MRKPSKTNILSFFLSKYNFRDACNATWTNYKLTFLYLNIITPSTLYLDSNYYVISTPISRDVFRFLYG